MAESQVRSLSLFALAATLVVGGLLAASSEHGFLYALLGASAIAAGQLLTVPAPSGERLFICARDQVPLLRQLARRAGRP